MKRHFNNVNSERELIKELIECGGLRPGTTYEPEPCKGRSSSSLPPVYCCTDSLISIMKSFYLVEIRDGREGGKGGRRLRHYRENRVIASDPIIGGLNVRVQ